LPLPPAEKERVGLILREYCEEKVPLRVRDQLQLDFRFDGNNAILFERRPAWDGRKDWIESNVAKFRYFVGRAEWEVYWCDRNLRWRRYDLLAPSRRFTTLLTEVDSDPTCIFWG
jgi:hypothetical protein